MKSAVITIVLLALCPLMASATGTIDLEEAYRSLDEETLDYVNTLWETLKIN